MPWKTMDVEEQKVRFVVAASRREKALSALCEEFGISRPTGYRWWRRYEEAGLVGISERSRRPKQSPGRTAAELERRVVELRQRYPDWGARKLQVLLARDGVELTRSTVHRILLRHDLVHDPERHRQAPGRFQRAAPNELWQMDFKSPKGWNAAVGPLSVLDDCSRYLLVLQAVWTNHGARVREQLESVFITCGVPQAMLMDHGIPWWSERAPSGVTRLTVWLMKQGIQLIGAAFATPRPRARWSDFMVPWNGRCVCGRYRASSRKPGWMSFAGSTTTCVRMRPWACRLRRVSGTAANAVTIRILRAGSIRGEPKL